MVVDHNKLAFDKLTGKYKHYCWEWDELAIDETCPEFLACTCYNLKEAEWHRIERSLLKYIMTEDQRHAQLP